MTLQPSPYELIRAIQDQQRATDRLIQMLAGMLDKSSPEPLLSGGPVVVSNVVRLTEEAARPGETIEIDGKAVHTTRRRAKLLRMVMDQPLTLSAMARAGVSPTVAGMKAQIRDTNADLERAGVTRRVRMQALPPQRRGARGGREPALYALLEPKQEIATPVVLTAVQDEAAAGSNPEQGADDSASGDGDAIAAQSAQFVTLTGEGEGDHHSLVDPSPAADEELPATAQGAGECAPRAVGEGDEPASAAPDLVKPAGANAAGGYSVDPEAQKDSVDRTGRRNGGIGRTGSVAADEVEAETPAALITAGERVLDMWANTNFTAKLIAEKAGCAPSSVSAFVSIAKAKGDPRALARTPEALAGRSLRDERPALSSEPALPASPIEPGDLIAVDVKLRRVRIGRHGGYETSTVQMARALDLLRGGQMFGLDAIARKAGWQSAEVARNALLLERNRLTQRGLDLYLDKFNARLREAS